MSDRAEFHIDIPPALQRLMGLDVARLAAETANEGIGFAQQVVMTDTPVDENRARDAWTITKEASEADPEAVLSNNTPYILNLEYGSVPGERPWPTAGRPDPVDGRIRTEIASDGPNAGNVVSTQAPHGMIRTNLPLVGEVVEEAFNRRMRDHV